MELLKSIKLWRESNRKFITFIVRFALSFALLTLFYESYIFFTNKVGELDLVTYFISRGSFETAKMLGVADCQWSCFLDGCRIGREGKMVNIIEGCNGLRLAIVYSAYIIGIGGVNWNSLIQMLIGFFVVQAFNILRIGLLIVLRDGSGDYYFFFIKYLFTITLYISVVLLWLIKPRLDRLIFSITKR